MEYCEQLRCYAFVPCSEHQQVAQVVRGAVVTDLKSPPVFQDVEIAAPSSDQYQVTVLAAGLHPLVKARASGMHYSSSTKVPFVPGVDGIGRLPNGELVYLMALEGENTGTFAPRANIRKIDCLPVPFGADPFKLAAQINPAMPVWLGLRRRASLKRGFSLLVLGVTGNAGHMSLHLAKLLGCTRIVGVARNQQTMDRLVEQGLMDVAIALGDDDHVKQQVAQEAANVDVVLDFLWGSPAEIAMGAILSKRVDSTQRLDWVQCGQMAGANVSLPGGLLRMGNFRLCGTGIGPESWDVMRSELTQLIAVLAAVDVPVVPDIVPIAEVESVWNKKEAERIVFSMGN